MSAKLPVLLVIDQATDTGESLKIIGNTSTPPWRTEVADSIDAVSRLQAGPRLILLHLGDGTRWSEDEMLALIVRRGWASRTVLVTNAHSPTRVEQLRSWRAMHSLRAMLPRPLDLLLIGKWLHETSASPEAVIGAPTAPLHITDAVKAAHVNMLTPAVLVFSVTPENQVPHLEWANESASQVNGGTFSGADFRRIALLRAMLAEDAKSGDAGLAPERRAKCLDWDVDRKQWVECRLHTLDEGRLFWYTRDWRRDGAVEEEFSNFENEKDLAARFGKLCDYLAKRWTITRVRLYQVVRLPDGLGYIAESNDHTHDQVVMLDSSLSNGMPWMVVPRFQSGSGWPDANPEQGLTGAAAWWNHVFKWSSLVPKSTSGTATSWRQPQSPELTNNQPELEPVQGNCNTDQVETVAWGKPQQRLMDVFPGELMSKASKQDEVLISAMLTMDRRHDHFLDRGDTALTNPDKERPRFTLAATTGRLGTALDQEEVDALAGGTLPALRKQLARWMLQDHEDRLRRWHKVLSRHILSGIGTLAGKGGMAALTKVCEDLVQQWPSLWEREMDEVRLPKGYRASVRNWFFATEFDEDRIDVPAGAGPLWKVYQTSGLALAKSELVRRLWSDELPDWAFLTVQDYPAWRVENLADHAPDFDKAVWNELSIVKTWVGIRLPQQQGFPKAMMVVHISDATNAAWSTMLQLLVIAAQRMYPAFMLALADEHERSAWASSVVHELKTGAATMHKSLQQAAKRPANTNLNFVRLIDIAHSIENLSRDYLSFLDPKHALFDTNELPAGQVAALEQVQHALAPWVDRYPNRGCALDPGTLEKTHTLQLVAPHLWRRVIRVLLHNAFRHGQGQVRVRLCLAENCLVMEVANDAGPDAIVQLIAAHNVVRGSITAPYATVRVGMRAAKLLCRAARAKLLWHYDATEGSELRMVVHQLFWPLADLSKGSGEVS